MADYYVNSVTATGWVALTAYVLGDRKVPSRAYATAAARAWTYEVTIAGITAATEPAWPTTDGATVEDGTVTWTARIPNTWANAGGHVDYLINNLAVGDDRIFVGPDHSESLGAAYYITGSATVSSFISVICAGNTTDAPPITLATTGVIATTGAADIILSRNLYIYGLSLQAASGAVNGYFRFNTWDFSSRIVAENCLLEVRATGGAAGFAVTGTNTQSAGLIVLKNTKLKSSGGNATGFHLGAQGRLLWDGGSIDTTWAHASFIGAAQQRSASAAIRGVDLSLLGSTKNLVNTTAIVADIDFINCKLGVSVNVVNAVPTAAGGPHVRLHNCDSAATNYRYQSVEFQGQAFTETTIVKTGGSTDGTTAYSIRMLSSANCTFLDPLSHDTAAIWNESTTAITVTVDIVHDSLTALTDGEVWLEVDYLGTSTFPIGSKASDAKGLLATAAAQTASTAAWTTTGLTNPNKQKLEVTFTPAMKGYLLPRVKLAKPSYTIYVDNKAVIA